LQIKTATFSRPAYKPEDFPRDERPQVALVGRSNVGKSTLLNAVVGARKLARVSQTPGKTQAVQFYLINEKFYLVDLPGYGYAKVPRAMAHSWGHLVRSYLEGSEQIRTIFLLLDSRRVPSPQDREMMRWMDETGRRWKVILTKVDKLSKNELAKQKKMIAAETGCAVSELTLFTRFNAEGREEIWREILGALETD